MLRTRVIVFLAMSVFAASMCTVAAADEKYVIDRKYVPGEKVSFNLKGEMKGTTEITAPRIEHKAMRVRNSGSLSLAAHYRVLDLAPDGTVTLGVQIDRLAIDMKYPKEHKRVVIDTKQAKVTVNGSTRPIDGGRQFSVEHMSLLGKELVVKKGPTGKMVEGGSEFGRAWNRMLKRVGFGSDDSDPCPNLMREGAMDDRSWRPEHPVAVGDTWEREEEEPFSGVDPDKRFKVVKKYCLDSVEEVKGDRIARISYTSSLELPDLDLELDTDREMRGAKVREFSSQEGGVILWSLQRGRQIREDADHRFRKVITGEVEHTRVKVDTNQTLRVAITTKG